MKFIKLIPAIRSKTRAVKVQKFRRFGDNGLVVCSSTRLEGRAVPASDSFSVEDMIAVSFDFLSYLKFTNILCVID